jgi:hypothetical protein
MPSRRPPTLLQNPANAKGLAATLPMLDDAEKEEFELQKADPHSFPTQLRLFAVNDLKFPDRLREIPCSVAQGICAQGADFSCLAAALSEQSSACSRKFPVNSLFPWVWMLETGSLRLRLQPRSPANPWISGLREKAPEFRRFAKATCTPRLKLRHFRPILCANLPSVSGRVFRISGF